MLTNVRLPDPILPHQLIDQPPGGEPGTSLWWLSRLSRRMTWRNQHLHTLRAYYRGEQDTWRLASDAHRSAFGRLFDGLKANLAKPVVDAVEQRLVVDGFRMANDAAGERKAWRIWQDCNLDADSSLAHTEALSVGECPVIVWPDDDGRPTITVEDPTQVYVEYDVLHRRRALAAVKRWYDPDEQVSYYILYLPDRVEWWRSPGAGGPWRPYMTGANPMGRVPVVTMFNMPRLVEPIGRYSRGEAEHEAVLTQLDLYNKTLLDMATTSEFMAFPQRFAIGVTLEDESYVPTDEEDRIEMDADGLPIQTEAATLTSGPHRVWKFESPDTKVGQFAVADLSTYARMLEVIRSDISSETSTPHRKLLPPPTSVPPSGESVRLSDEALTAKVKHRQLVYGDAWEDVMRLAFLAAGDTARAERPIETLWHDPEVRTESEHMDALIKLQAIGVPQLALWERVPASPQETERWRAMQATSPSPQSSTSSQQPPGAPFEPEPNPSPSEPAAASPEAT